MTSYSAASIIGRNRAPVFVIGCARSGTTLLYDMLLSAGGFALYLGESNIFNLVGPRFGDLGVRSNRERMLDVWLESRLFRVSGLSRGQVEDKVLDDCKNAGDFLRILMDEIARQQNAVRWAANAPEEALYLPLIKATIPEALIVHVIRDGRDVALSLSQKRYIRPFPWKGRETAEGASLYWEWIVQRARSAGSHFGNEYTEIRFEELVSNPCAVLEKLGSFMGQDLDYARIQKAAIGSVARPNTSFASVPRAEFNPVGRWKELLPTDRLTRIEGLVGRTLTKLGYNLATPGEGAYNKLDLAWTRLVYRGFFELKFQSKNNSFFRSFRPKLTAEEIDQTVIVDDKAVQITRSPIAEQPGRSQPSPSKS